SSTTLVSCSSTTSGAAVLSQSSSAGRRMRIEFTFHVAIFMTRSVASRRSGEFDGKTPIFQAFTGQEMLCTEARMVYRQRQEQGVVMRVLAAIAVSLAVVAGTAIAADAPPSLDKCTAEAKAQNLTPTKTKAYMSGCMAKTGSANKPSTAQADKRRECTNQANGQKLKGGARKAFGPSC